MIPTSTRLAYANGYLDLGMVKEAAAEIREINGDDQDSRSTIAMKNRLYMVSENWRKLIVVARELANRAPEETYGWVNWAYALREIEKPKEAKKVATKALQHHPEEAILWYNLACYCSLLAEWHAASNHLRKAISFDASFKKTSFDDPDLDALRQWEGNQKA